MSRQPEHEHTDSRKDRSRDRRKAFRAVNILWGLELVDDRFHEWSRRALRLKYKA